MLNSFPNALIEDKYCFTKEELYSLINKAMQSKAEQDFIASSKPSYPFTPFYQVKQFLEIEENLK